MSYIDLFVAAVPTANKADYVSHASVMSEVFTKHGAIRIVEAWGDDVQHGQVTDFYRAVQAREDEDIVIGWIEWPDKATRDKGMAAAAEDPLTSGDGSELPFDGMRMIFGGFEKLFEK